MGIIMIVFLNGTIKYIVTRRGSKAINKISKDIFEDGNFVKYP